MDAKKKSLRPDVDGYIDHGFGLKEFVGPADGESDERTTRIIEKHYAKTNAELTETIANFCEPEPCDKWMNSIESGIFQLLNEWVVSLSEIRPENLLEWSKKKNEREFLHTRIDGESREYFVCQLKEDVPIDILELRGCLDQLTGLRRLVSAGTLQPGSLTRILKSAFVLGRDLERSLLLCEAPLAKVGKKVTQAASAGGKLNSKFSENQKAEIGDEVSRLIRENASQNSACAKVGCLYKAAPSTILRIYKAHTG